MNFYINIRNRVAEVRSASGVLPLLVCDNTDDLIVFSFDSEWEAHTERTARFVYRTEFGKGELVFVDVPFTGDRVSIPTLHNVKEVFIGVSAGNLVTTSAARLSAIPSIHAFSAESAEPDSEVDSEDTVKTESKAVSLDFSTGNQLVNPTEGMLMKAVLIRKPDTLIPGNIRAGVTIAGIEGTYRGESAATFEPPQISLEGSILKMTPGTADTESYEIYAGGEVAYVTDQTTVDLAEILDYLGAGTYTVYVTAWRNDSKEQSERSNSISYTIA